jgi:anti-sigma28 factor (negative regulator of flagellin synthesis)
MKIDDRVSNYMALLINEATKPEVHTPGAHTVGGSAPVSVDISPAAVQLSDDEKRRERLNLIRQQLAEGSYNISGKDVANKILNVLKG